MHRSPPPHNSMSRTATLALGGMAAALIFVATAFVKLPLPMPNGYAHLGDAFILLSAALLGWVAVPAAAVGSLLSDIVLGYAMYALPTFLIKGCAAALAVLAFRRKGFLPRLLLLLLAEAAMVAGYFCAEWLVLGYGWAGAVAGLMGNTIQGGSGILVALVLLPALKQVKLPTMRR